MGSEKESAVVALLMLDVCSRYVAVAPLKQRNAQTVGRVLVYLISSVRDGTMELAFDNEPVLVAGANFANQRGPGTSSLHISVQTRWVTKFEQT